MPHDDADLPDTPKCLLCSRHREGRRYRVWGATHISTTTKTKWLFSDETLVTSKYRDMKRVSYYACRPCARRSVLRSSVPTAGTFAFIAVSFLVAAVMIPQENKNVKIGMAVAAGLSALLLAASVAESLLRDTDSEGTEGPVRDRATRHLKPKGKGDTYFTEQEYDVLFLKKSADGSEPARPKTAAELLGGVEAEEDDRPARRRRR